MQRPRYRWPTLFEPIGVKCLQGWVTRIDAAEHRVEVETADGVRTLDYARLAEALGSALVNPKIAGVAEYTFDLDPCEGAEKLREHLAFLPSQPASAGRYTAVLVPT